MKKLNFPMLSDILFYGVCAFFLTLSIARYCRLPLWLCLVLALLLAPAVGLVCFLLLYRKSQKLFLTKKQREDRDALLFHLALEKPERVRAALLEAYLADGRQAHCEGEQLCVDGTPVVPLFRMEPVSADEIAKLIGKFGTTSFRIACKSLSVEAEKLLASFSLGAEREDEIFDLFSRTGKTPNPLICGEVPRKSFRTKIKRAFSKSNARPFFFCGILLLILSLFVLFPVYYLTTGLILLLSSVVIRVAGAPA